MLMFAFKDASTKNSDPMTVTWQEELVSWEADDIVQFYIALLDFFPATL